FGSDGSPNFTDGLDPISYDLGEFVNNIVRPVLEKFKLFNPMPPEIARVLTTPLPLLNVKPIDLIREYYDLPEAVDLLFEIPVVVDDIEKLVNHSTSVDLSQFFNEPPPPNPGESDPDGGDTGSFLPFLDELRKYGITLPIIDNLQQSFIKIISGQD